MTILNLHRTNTDNIGDLMAAPGQYFEEIAERLDILGWSQAEQPEVAVRKEWKAKVTGANVIIGGGGLLEIDYFAKSLELVQSLKPRKLVVWGAGHNDWELRDWRELKRHYKMDFSAFDLVGVRDWGHRYRWVPCASCMAPAFDTLPEPAHELVVYTTKGFEKHDRHRLHVPEGTPRLDNHASFDEVIPFLASGETILTSSYHGAYWGNLLGRKVVAFPSSSKYYDMRHPVPICDPEDWKRFSRLATRYPEALQECRNATKQFASEVFALMNS